jgi:hypothetical protein
MTIAAAKRDLRSGGFAAATRFCLIDSPSKRIVLAPEKRKSDIRGREIVFVLALDLARKQNSCSYF